MQGEEKKTDELKPVTTDTPIPEEPESKNTFPPKKYFLKNLKTRKRNSREIFRGANHRY